MENYLSLLEQRQQFEDELYDFLISQNSFYLNEEFEDENILVFQIPESFWEPVTIRLSNQEIQGLEKLTRELECLICKDNKQTFNKLRCCNKKMCCECVNNWFTRSVFCPFCKHDLRTLF